MRITVHSRRGHSKREESHNRGRTHSKRHMRTKEAHGRRSTSHRRRRKFRKPKDAHALIVKLAEEMCKKREWRRTNPKNGYCLELTRYYCDESALREIAKQVAKEFPKEVADEDPIKFVKRRLVNIRVVQMVPCETDVEEIKRNLEELEEDAPRSPLFD